WRLARRKSTSPATPALRSTSKSATLSIATVFGSSSALDGYPNARNHAVALLSRCHRIYTTLRDLDGFRGNHGCIFTGQGIKEHLVKNFLGKIIVAGECGCEGQRQGFCHYFGENVRKIRSSNNRVNYGG